MTITLNDIRLYAYHGVLPEEACIGAWFRVSIAIEVDCPRAIQSDELSDTVNYADVANIVKQEMSTRSRLIEHVAGRISQRVLREFKQVSEVTVTVHKEHPPIAMECASSSVTINVKRR